MMLFGRRRIYSSAEEITADNVIDEVNDALAIHSENVKEEEYLYWYRRGMQPILDRRKEVRPEICNKIVVNNADMVVTFKNGYFLSKPATYVSRKENKAIANKVKKLNEYIHMSGKEQADNEVVDWFHTVGVGAIYVEPNNDDDIPIKVYSVDPRSAFVVYSLKPGNKPVMGINVVIRDKVIYADVYTEKGVFKLAGRQIDDTEIRTGIRTNGLFVSEIVSVDTNRIGKIPIIEYTYDSNRMGAFESAVPIMDSINLIESNRADGIEQFIQSLVVLYNCELEDGTTANSIRQAGLIQLKSVGDNKADIKVISEQLDQTQTQATLDDLYEQMLDKCAMPSVTRNSGSTGDNGSAVYLRNGYQQADTAARCTSDLFEKSNELFTDLLLAILKQKFKFEISKADFNLYIEHTSVSNLLVKTQAALNMKELGFSPALALERSGLSNDPITDIAKSQKFIDAKWNPVETVETNPNEGNEEDTSLTDGQHEIVPAVNVD